MSDTVLEIENLDFGYTKERLLYENFSLHVNIGDVVCIVGASGSGKSTLFELIAGNLKAHKGNIDVA
ncbi:MAG: ATP-binding cassette domain-containing protein, partial [Clostridia bacterium]|nr:ATP-binding cassette domain-containing protein [Clostridia bacterium]